MFHRGKSMCKITIIISFPILLLISSCQRNTYVDPFWNVNLNADKTTILHNLNERTLKGDLKSSIFSFEKIMYVRTKKFDARLTGNLNYPVFLNNLLDKLSYSISVEFKNEKTYAFNDDFYHYFKDKLETAYGKPMRETVTGNNINVTWLLPNGMAVVLNISKDINTYQVQFQKH